LPITPSVLATLRETARLFSTHYSTMIEGNRLTQDQVSKVIERQHFPGRDRDEKEVLGYYAALDKTEQFAAARGPVTELHIQALHALVMAGGRKRVKPSPYRDGQNVIRDSRSGGIVYMPPEAKDVPEMMRALTAWIKARSSPSRRNSRRWTPIPRTEAPSTSRWHRPRRPAACTPARAPRIRRGDFHRSEPTPRSTGVGCGAGAPGAAASRASPRSQLRPSISGASLSRPADISGIGWLEVDLREERDHADLVVRAAPDVWS
jgi:hypothetical protein